MPGHNVLGILLDRLTKGHRFVLHLPNAHTADLSLIQYLIQESQLRDDFFLSLGYPEQHAGTPHREALRIRVANWTREEMKRAFAERFSPQDVPSDFLDFAWSSAEAGHSRELFAQVLLRVVANNWLTFDHSGKWVLDSEWRKNKELVDEFSRDLLEPINRIKSELESSGTPENRLWQLDDFLDAAALCHPAIPVNPLLQLIGISEEERDGFIDWLDESMKVDEEEGIMENLGFQHPGFPPSQLIYRFRNPLLPEALLRKLHNKRTSLAERLLKFLSEILWPDTRAVAELFLRLTDSAGLRQQSERYQNTLSFWSSIGEAEALRDAIVLQLKERSLSPELLWSIIQLSKNKWPPSRRWALIEAYGQQSDGVSSGNLFEFQLEKGEILFRLGQFPDAIGAVEEAASIGPMTYEARGRTLTLLGLSHRGLGHLTKARGYLESAAEAAEKSLPFHKLDFATCLNNLALLYDSQAEYAKAEPLYQRAVEIQESVLGPENPDIAVGLNNLAMIYRSQAEHSKAEPLFQRAIALQEKAWGPEHPNVANTLNNLAMLYHEEADYTKAESLFQRALSIRERVLGPEHPDVAVSLNNLATLYESQADYGKAKALLHRALAIQEKVLGSEHPDLATSLNNLALLYDSQMESAKAELLHERALAIREKVFGPEHPDVATSLNSLAWLYKSKTEYAKAEPLFQRALEIEEKLLGSKHPTVAITLINLAELYESLGEYARAEPLFQRALEIREKVFGSEHPLTEDARTALYSLQESRNPNDVGSV
jgi:tetratricopeptide (TPR) repeat protein